MPMESALAALAQGIKPPTETPPASGQGVPWEKLLSLLPIILAGMKGGMAGAGGYARGWSQGELQNRELGQQQNQLDYARQQDQQRLDRQQQQDQIAEAERMRRNQRQTLEDLRGEAGAAVESVPFANEEVQDVPFPVTVTPEDRAYAQTKRAGEDMGADPSMIRRVAGQIPAAMSQRKKTAAASILGGLKGVDPAALRGKTWMDGLSLDQLVALAGDAGAGFGLPKEAPLQAIEEMVGGRRVKTMKRLGEGESVPVLPPDRTQAEPGSWTDTGRVNDKGEAIYINNKTMQTRAAPGVGAKPATQAQMDEQARKRQIVVDATSRTLDAVDELLDERGRLRDNVRGAIGGSRVFQTQRIPGTSAYDAQASIDRVKARLVTDLMAELKAQSRTGATGFGQLNLQELKIMQDAAAKLDPGQSEASLEAELRKIRDRLNMIIKEPARTPEASRGGRSTLKDRLRGTL